MGLLDADLAADSARDVPRFVTARRWGLDFGPGIVDTLRGSGVASRMLADVHMAVEHALHSAIRRGTASPQEIIGNYPRVLSRCDLLTFDEPAQALAYLALHLPDRYCRVFQVLEGLLVNGMLPLGRAEASLAAVDIGAGPGPGMFAIRNFYAALSHIARDRYGISLGTLGTATIVERSRGMSSTMHHFAEALILMEQARRPHQPGSDDWSPHPFAAELASSATPFGASQEDFGELDLVGEHDRVRRQIADELYETLDTNRESANRLAATEPINAPRGYALAVMTNFLTTTDAIPRFEEALQRLMGGALVPGGIVLVLGGIGEPYPTIYEQLDLIATNSGLQVMDGFENPVQAGKQADERKRLELATRSVWRKLAQTADNAEDVRSQLRDLRAADIFDDSQPYTLPRFRARVYRRGRWPREEKGP